MTGRLWIFLSDLTLGLSDNLLNISKNLYRVSVYSWERSMGG